MASSQPRALRSKTFRIEISCNYLLLVRIAWTREFIHCPVSEDLLCRQEALYHCGATCLAAALAGFLSLV